MNNLNNWTEIENRIEREFTFDDFSQAFAFMHKVALLAEIMNHHPDWSNSYNIVKIQLTTHSKGKVTELDIRLAESINQIFDHSSHP